MSALTGGHIWGYVLLGLGLFMDLPFVFSALTWKNRERHSPSSIPIVPLFCYLGASLLLMQGAGSRMLLFLALSLVHAGCWLIVAWRIRSHQPLIYDAQPDLANQEPETRNQELQ